MNNQIMELASMIKDRMSCRGRSGTQHAAERRMFLLTTVWFGAMTLFRTLVLRGAVTAEAAGVAARTGVIPAIGTGALPVRVAVRSLVAEGGTKPGDMVTVRMIIDTLGSGKISVPWNIYRGNTVLKSGIQQNIAAGTSFEVSATWQASAGTQNFYGDVDPYNTLREPSSELRNNISQTVSRFFPDWGRWIAGAKQGIREGVPQWVTGLKFPGIVINSGIATGGRLEPSSDLKSLISSRMRESGAPQSVVDGFMGAVTDAWNSWAASVRVPGLPWYPAFVAWPGPMAVPMPNIPTPLALLLQNPALLVPGTLATEIKARVRDAAANEAIDEFCLWLNNGFNAWVLGAMVSLVMGKGSVPSFSPPYVPVGPVVGGETLATPIVITPAPRWL